MANCYDETAGGLAYVCLQWVDVCTLSHPFVTQPLLNHRWSHQRGETNLAATCAGFTVIIVSSLLHC